MIARFLARWPIGAVDRHELPMAVAAEFATQLRGLGVTVVWAPPEAPPPPAPQPEAPRRERKKMDRERRRQFRELGHRGMTAAAICFAAALAGTVIGNVIGCWLGDLLCAWSASRSKIPKLGKLRARLFRS